MGFFGDVERVLADLYPYRWWITIGVVVALTAVVAVGYRMGWHKVIWRHSLAVAIRRHKLAAAVVATPLLGFIVFAGYYTVSPIFERTTLVEASPLDALLAGSPGSGPATDGTIEVLKVSDVTPSDTTQTDADSSFRQGITHSGQFEGADEFHFGSGTALLIGTAPGLYTLRFEDFSVRNGPGLYVYLSPKPESTEGHRWTA